MESITGPEDPVNLSMDGVEALEAIVRTGSFAAAARELHKAQSAVSYAIAQLEERLGVELFDRSGHRARLTDAGRLVLEEGRGLLATARRIEGLAARLRQGWEARLAVVIDGILPQAPIMAALKQMADEQVPTQIQLKVEFLEGVQFRFERDAADMMLVNGYSPRDELEALTLPEVTSVLVASSAHPLAAAEHLSLAELQRHVELSIHDSSEAADVRKDPTAFGGSRVFFLSDFMAKRQALLMGLGFGWMPTYMVEEELAAGALTELPYERGSRYSVTPQLVYRLDRPPGRAGERFIELLLGREVDALSRSR